jgi:hypothetical protein
MSSLFGSGSAAPIQTSEEIKAAVMRQLLDRSTSPPLISKFGNELTTTPENQQALLQGLRSHPRYLALGQGKHLPV